MALEIVDKLGPIPQIIFAAILALGFLLIHWRVQRRAIEDAADQAVASKHGEIQQQSELHIDGPIMATHRLCADLVGRVSDMNQALVLFIETSKLRDLRAAEIVADQFRLLRSIEEKVEAARQAAETHLREFRDFRDNQRPRR